MASYSFFISAFSALLSSTISTGTVRREIGLVFHYSVFHCLLFFFFFLFSFCFVFVSGCTRWIKYVFTMFRLRVTLLSLLCTTLFLHFSLWFCHCHPSVYTFYAFFLLFFFGHLEWPLCCNVKEHLRGRPEVLHLAKDEECTMININWMLRN